MTILSHIFINPIVVYDNYSNVKYLFNEGPIKINRDTIKNFTDESKKNSTIFIKFGFEGSKDIPTNIYSIYFQ